MSKPVTRNLSVYDGRRLLGHIEITPRTKRAPKVKAKDATGKNIGSFTSRKAALRAIDAANMPAHRPANKSANLQTSQAATALQPDRPRRC
jgi:hypothetical protein